MGTLASRHPSFVDNPKETSIHAAEATPTLLPQSRHALSRFARACKPAIRLIIPSSVNRRQARAILYMKKGGKEREKVGEGRHLC